MRKPNPIDRALEAFVVSLASKSDRSQEAAFEILTRTGMAEAVLDAAKAYHAEEQELSAMWELWTTQQGFPTEEEAERRLKLTDEESEAEDQIAFDKWLKEQEA